jgi:hypothetical protein
VRVATADRTRGVCKYLGIILVSKIISTVRSHLIINLDETHFYFYTLFQSKYKSSININPTVEITHKTKINLKKLETPLIPLRTATQLYASATRNHTRRYDVNSQQSTLNTGRWYINKLTASPHCTI